MCMFDSHRRRAHFHRATSGGGGLLASLSLMVDKV